MGLEGEPYARMAEPVPCEVGLQVPRVVIVPNYRKKLLYGKLRNQVGPILKGLCRQKGVEVVEGHVMPDHVHMCLSIPPKNSVACVVGFLARQQRRSCQTPSRELCPPRE